MSTFSRLFPILFVLGCAAWLGKQALPVRDEPGALQIHEFGKLPVVYQGRVKPFDTLARNTLAILSDKQSFKDSEGRSRPAIEWLLDVIARPEAAKQHAVFRITSFELQNVLGLEQVKRFRYPYSAFEEKLPEIEQHVQHAAEREAGQRDLFDNKVLEFWRKVTLYRVMAGSFTILPVRNDEEHFRADLAAAIQRFAPLGRFSLPHAVPSNDESGWKPLAQVALESLVTGETHPAAEALTPLFRAYGEQDAAAFNAALERYQQYLAANPLKEHPALGFEAFFNGFAPFYHCSVLYVFAFLLCCLAWLGWSEALEQTAFRLIWLTFAVHTAALGARVYISGYPPITNLYGTAVFIGWGCVLLGLMIEWVYRMGIGNLVASVIGFATLVIAHFLAGDGDTLEMMQAVLDTKFWLATHVIIINFGYSATFLAGVLAVLYILRGVLTRSVGKDTERVFGRMIYGVLCFALLLSFLGTVLGGLWADDSWGRFWGWDPKENGALLIVLWNALILHARWGGMVKTRGIANLAVFGNVVTAWSWFGVNQLGVGLHSYGFTDSVAFWLVLFVLSQMIVIGLGVLPRSLWRSAAAFQKKSAAVRPDQPSVGGRVQPTFRAPQ